MEPNSCMIRHLLVGLLLLPMAAHTAQTVDTGPKVSARQRLIQKIVDLTNAERARFNLKPLTYDNRLEKAAQWMAEDMAINNYFDHTDHQGRTIAERVPTFGYKGYRILRENLAAGQQSEEEVIKAWMDSPHHREAILCDKCEHIGVGFYFSDSSKYKLYWVQEFGALLPGED